VKDGKRRLLDGIVAPRFTESAVGMLSRKGDKCRFIANAMLGALNTFDCVDRAQRMRYVRGGFLVQPNATFNLADHRLVSVGGGMPSEAVMRDIALAWAVGSTSNSNTITLVKDGKLIGNGVGQQDRVSVCELAIKKARSAGHDTQDAVAYSDSFFPFPDGPVVLCEAGIKTVFTTSGSMNDGKVFETFRKYGVEVYTLPDTVARGFFGH
jgi:phosphoribosylaminoimidazolecarboxamide formyltransferase/IMP cyclohydrolase